MFGLGDVEAYEYQEVVVQAATEEEAWATLGAAMDARTVDGAEDYDYDSLSERTPALVRRSYGPVVLTYGVDG